MAKYSCLVALAIYLLITTPHSRISSGLTAAATGDFDLKWVHAKLPGSAIGSCHGSIAECMTYSSSDQEFSMDSEINRRILATNNYISYEALKRNSVPCSKRGASYYNCQTGAQANPYSRGCSAITRCRS